MNSRHLHTLPHADSKWIAICLAATLLVQTVFSQTRESTQSASPADTLSSSQTKMVDELIDSYKHLGWMLAFLENWGQGPARSTLRIHDQTITGTSGDGRVVSCSTAPESLPVPNTYNSLKSEVSNLGAQASLDIGRYYYSYEEYKKALKKMNSNPNAVDSELTNVIICGATAFNRGRKALRAIGIQPPRLFPDGGFPEPYNDDNHQLQAPAGFAPNDSNFPSGFHPTR